MLSEPGWLLLALPLGLLWWYWRHPSTCAQVLRAATLLMALLALAGFSWPRQHRQGVVIVLADRSASMPPKCDDRHKEVLGLLYRTRRGDEQIGVVAFGKHAVVEQMPQSAPFRSFVHEVDADGSDLAAALDKALELVPLDRPARMLVLSDGRWTGAHPMTLVSRLATRQVAVDYRLLSRSSAGDLAIASVEAPSCVESGAGFYISAWLDVPVPQKVRAELTLGDTVLATAEQEFSAGRHRVVFRARGLEPGTLDYRLRVQGQYEDPVPENNAARVLVQVAGNRPVLHVSTRANAGLAQLLARAGFRTVSRTPEQCRWTLEQLSNYTAVILENVAADSIGIAGMNVLSHWVRDAGGGLMMTGGRNSYAVGNYYGSPLADILPVSLEMRQEHRKFSVAIVLVLDRSGSMSAPVGDGRCKMDLANLGAAQVLELLTPVDEIGVIAVDSQPRISTPLTHPTSKSELRKRILGIQSEGGGIFVYTGLLEAAKMIQHAKAATRHILLFADAADAEEPGDYQKLLAALREAGVPVSVIGLGKPTDVDAEFLRDVARRGGGNIYFTEHAEQLPLLFAQDTFQVARSTFVEEVTPVAGESGLLSLTPRPFALSEPVGGYNLCYLRQEAIRAAVTQDEFRAPLVAAWHRGLGRVVCYTGEVDGKYTGPIARWPDYGDFLVSLVRWAAGLQKGLPSDMAWTLEQVRGGARIRLHLDPDKETPPFGRPPKVIAIRQRSDGQIVREEHTLAWSRADTLELQLPLASSDTVLATLDLPGHGPVSLPPVCLPYSPEYQPVEGERVGASASRAGETSDGTLAQLALATGGKERTDVTTIWQDLPATCLYYPLRPWLLGLALLTLLVEILERRTGWITALVSRVRLQSLPGRSLVTRLLRSPRAIWQTLRRRVRRKTAPEIAAAVAASAETESAASTAHARKSAASGGVADDATDRPPTSVAPADQPSSPAPPPASPLLSALEQARRQSQRRFPSG